MSLSTQLLHVKIPSEFLLTIDTAATKLYLSRSEFIRRAVIEATRKATEQAFPLDLPFQILLTDEQLDELWDILKLERVRRRRRLRPV